MDEFLKVAGGVLGTVAPTIAAAFGGPLAGLAATAVVKALGLPQNTSLTELAAKVQGATVDQLQAIKLAEIQFQSDMAKLDIQLDQISATDRASARDMEVKTTSAVPGLLGVTVFVGFFGITATMAFHDIPTVNAGAFNILTGALAAAVGSVMNFFFGSSADSRAKTQMLYQSVPASTMTSAPQPAGRGIK